MRRAAGLPLSFAALVAPPLAMAAPLGLAPLFILTALASLALAWREKPWRRINPALATALAGVAGWAALSLLWALDPPQGARTALALALTLLGGMLLLASSPMLLAGQSRRLAVILGIGVALAILYAVAERFTPGLTPLVYPALRGKPPGDLLYLKMIRLSRGLSVLALVSVPAALALGHHGFRGGALALALASAAIIVSGNTLAAKLGLSVAWLMALVAWYRPKTSFRLLAALMVLAALAAPLARFLPAPQVTADHWTLVPASAHHRLTIWRFTAERIWEHPLMGWGLDASRSIPGGDDEVIIIRHDLGDARIPEAQLPLHPHSMPLQWWLELGGVGVVSTLAALLLVCGRLSRLAPPTAAPAAGAMGAAFIVSSVSFGAWQSWWLGMMWMIAALVAGLFASAEDGR